MDYLDCFDRQELIKERARCSSELNQLIIKKEDDQSVKENVEKVKNDLNAIMLKCDERLKAQKEERQLGTDAAREQSLIPLSGDVMMESMQKTAKLQKNILSLQIYQRILFAI